VVGERVRPSKLLLPRLAADAVDRPRLLAALDRGLDAALILLSGPGGYGKTTLLRQWLATHQWPVAWLTLDDRDDAAGFVAHLVAALRPHLPDARWSALGLLRLPGAVAPADLGAALAEDLAAATGDAVLVLDDYQEVVDLGVHGVLDALLRHPPPRLHLVVATREDPALPLARLRAGGQLVELRAADLRFTPAEAAGFFARALPEPPPPEAVGLLAVRMEGWGAGLRLAALALRAHAAPGEVAAAVARRSPAAVTEYLLAEVYERQPPALQDFLLSTAVAERLCAPLCDALLSAGAAPSGDAAGRAAVPVASGAALLEAAARANLFLARLDEPAVEPLAASAPFAAAAGDVWYRYHPLFREMLLHQLRVRRGATAERELHTRAGAWFAAAGMVEEGIQHALAVGDTKAAAARVERHANSTLQEDEWPALERWMDRLPPEVVRRRPALLVARAWVAQRRGQYDALPALLAAAAAALGGPPPGRADAEAPDRPGESSGPARAALEGEIAALTEWRCMLEGDARGVLAAAERALALLPETCAHARGGAIGIAALAALAVDGEDAVIRWLDALPVLSTRDADAAVPWALPGVGTALILAGRHHDAARLGHALLRLGERPRQTNARCWGNVLLGVVEYEWDHLEAATRHLAAALEARERVRLMPLRVATFGLALTHQAQGRPGAADAELDRLVEVLARTANGSELARVEAFRVRLALRRGDMALARRWLPASAGLPPHWLDTVLDSPPLTRAWAQLCLAQQAPVPAAALADALTGVAALVDVTERLHLVTRQAQALALRALAQEALGDGAAAVASLARALEVAEPGGLVRTFVDLGAPLAPLLRRLAFQRPTWAYPRRVVAGYAGGADHGRSAPVRRPGATTDAPPSAPRGDLPAPLTDREAEVLEHLGRWSSNKEVAAALHVSAETVKRHASNIYAKLGVGGRREAVRRAAELGLLPLV
jgi:LuxR family maltose regulon positive regulatory protein